MTRRWPVVLLLALAVVAAPVAAHGNYVSADPQVSADGAVRIELAIVVTDASVVVHADDNGSIGRAIGHGSFEGYIAADHELELDPGFWANHTGNASLWVVLHRDDGDGAFDPDDDPPLTGASSDEPVADRFALRKASTGPVNVIAEHDQAQETDHNAVTIRQVRLASDGYVVLRADESGVPGRVVGTKALAAGEHGSVPVTIDKAFYERRPETFALWAVVHTSDGDNTFTASHDPAVLVGEHRVMSRFFVERTDPIEQTPTPTATTIPVSASPHSVTETPTDHGDHDHSPTATDEEGHGGNDHTHEEPAGTTTASDSLDHDDTHSAFDASTAAPGQPGFGLGLAVVAVLLGGWLASRRNRR